MHSHASTRAASARFRLAAAALAAVLTLTPTSPVLAAAGDLDTTFGVGGTVMTAVTPLLNGYANDVTIDASGRIVVAVTSDNYPAGTGRDFYVGRYNADGSLDSSFGTGGFARVGITSAADTESAHAVAVQPTDGKILVGGTAPIGKATGVAVARLNPDGSVDTSFGTGGKTQFAFVNRKDATCFDIAVQSNGAIVVVGGSDVDFGFARLTPAGQLDASFGSGGTVVVVTASRGSGPASARGVALQTIGGEQRILAAGNSPRTNFSPTQFALVRLRPNGSLDTSFGNGGKVLTAFGGPGQFGEALAVDSANNIVVVGRALPSDGRAWADVAAARYNSSGALLATITTNVSGPAGSEDTADTAHGVAIQVTGEIVVVCEAGIGGDENSDFAVVRYASDLSAVDATFGDSGIVVTDYAGGRDSATGGVALQTDGGVEKIVVAGAANALDYVALARYLE